MPRATAARALARLDRLLERGGSGRIQLLRYAVISFTPEPLFIFLAREFALRPTPSATLALYDGFCAVDALARLSVSAVLPPMDLRLVNPVRALREAAAAGQAPSTTQYRNTFDHIVAALRADPDGRLARVARTYDPKLTPQENLPGGKMNEVQRHFVDAVWKPRLRPLLVAAGFWQLSSID